MATTNPIVSKALNAARNAEWEKVYEIKGLPVKFVYRGEPYNDLKATVEGGNRMYVPLARIVASNPVSQAEAEKMAAAKWRQIKATANSATDGVYEKAINEASSRKFRPNDVVEWIDRHGNRNSGYYVRDNGPDRVTVSIERDGQGGGLEIPRAWIVANAVAANAKWVILYRDGGKEKIEAPSFDAAKKVAEQKSQASGRGYISVIVDDGVDYGVNARSRNSVVQKAWNAANYSEKQISDAAMQTLESRLRSISMPGYSGPEKKFLELTYRPSTIPQGSFSGEISVEANLSEETTFDEAKAGKFGVVVYTSLGRLAARTKLFGSVDEALSYLRSTIIPKATKFLSDGQAKRQSDMAAKRKEDSSRKAYEKYGLVTYSNSSANAHARSANSIVQKALNAVKNDTTPAVGSRWVHNDDNLFIVKVIGADGSSVRVQSADGGTCTYRLDEFLSDYRAANACKNAAAPSAELRRAYDDWQKAKAKFAKWWNPDRRLSERPPAGADEAQKAVAFSDIFLKEVGRRPPNGYGEMTLEQMLAK